MRRPGRAIFFLTIFFMLLLQMPLALSQAQSETEFRLVNSTSVWLTLYVDGTRSCSAPPGDQCVDLVVPGRHNVMAEAPDGRSISNSFDVPPGGFTWTITE